MPSRFRSLPQRCVRLRRLFASAWSGTDQTLLRSTAIICSHYTAFSWFGFSLLFFHGQTGSAAGLCAWGAAPCADEPPALQRAAAADLVFCSCFGFSGSLKAVLGSSRTFAIWLSTGVSSAGYTQLWRCRPAASRGRLRCPRRSESRAAFSGNGGVVHTDAHLPHGARCCGSESRPEAMWVRIFSHCRSSKCGSAQVPPHQAADMDILRCGPATQSPQRECTAHNHIHPHPHPAGLTDFIDNLRVIDGLFFRMMDAGLPLR